MVNFWNNNGTPDFSLSATPASQSVNQGSTAAYTVTESVFDNYSNTVTFSVSGLPAGASPTFTPPTLSGAGTTSLSITTLATTPLGSYPLTITGTDGVLTHTTSVTLVITAPDFSLAATPASQTVVVGKHSQLHGNGGRAEWICGNGKLQRKRIAGGRVADLYSAFSHGIRKFGPGDYNHGRHHAERQLSTCDHGDGRSDHAHGQCDSCGRQLRDFGQPGKRDRFAGHFGHLHSLSCYGQRLRGHGEFQRERPAGFNNAGIQSNQPHGVRHKHAYHLNLKRVTSHTAGNLSVDDFRQ